MAILEADDAPLQPLQLQSWRMAEEAHRQRLAATTALLEHLRELVGGLLGVSGMANQLLAESNASAVAAAASALQEAHANTLGHLERLLAEPSPELIGAVQEVGSLAETTANTLAELIAQNGDE